MNRIEEPASLHTVRGIYIHIIYIRTLWFGGVETCCLVQCPEVGGTFDDKRTTPVSYTHLDVYKRQVVFFKTFITLKYFKTNI